MKKTWKRLKLAAVLLSPALVVGWFFAAAEVDRYARETLTASVGHALHAPVRIKGVSVPWLGRVTLIRELEIYGPPGFTLRQPLLAVRRTTLDFPVSGLLQSEVTIDQVRLRDVVLTLQVREDGKTNVETLLERARARAAATPATTGPTGATPRRFLVRELRLEDASVDLLVGERRVRVDVPEVVLTDLDGSQTADELTALVIQGLLTAYLERDLLELPQTLVGSLWSVARTTHDLKVAVSGELKARVLDAAGKTLNIATKVVVDDLGGSMKSGYKTLEEGARSGLRSLQRALGR